MATKDINTILSISNALNAGVINSDTDTDGEFIDTQGFYGLTFSAEATAYTDGTFTLQVLESDTASAPDFTATAADFVIGAGSITAVDTPAKIGYVGKKRYARLRIVSTGVTTGATLTAIAIRGVPGDAPTAA
jgi:hypothetical protein